MPDVISTLGPSISLKFILYIYSVNKNGQVWAFASCHGYVGRILANTHMNLLTHLRSKFMWYIKVLFFSAKGGRKCGFFNVIYLVYLLIGILTHNVHIIGC